MSHTKSKRGIYVSEYLQLSARHYKLHLINHLCPQLNTYIQCIAKCWRKTKVKSEVQYSFWDTTATAVS